MHSRLGNSPEVPLDLKPSNIKDYFSSKKLRPSSKRQLPENTQSSSSCSEKPVSREKISEPQEPKKPEESEYEDAFKWTADKLTRVVHA